MDEFGEFEGRAAIPEFLMDPRGVIQRRWPWMLAVLLVSAIAAGAYVASTPLLYQASARILLTPQTIPEEFVRATSEEGLLDQVDAIVGEVLSRVSLTEVVDTLNLADRIAEAGSNEELLGEVRASITVQSDLDMPRRRGGGARIFAIRFASTDPEVSADVANELASRFVATHVRRQSRQANLTTGFLRREADRAEAELAEQRALITEFKQAHRGELPSELATKLARLERLQQQSQSLALRISDAEGRLLTLTSQGPAAQTRTSLLSELRARLVRERTLYTDEHPSVMALQRQIAALEAEIRAARAGGGASPDLLVPEAAVVQNELTKLRTQLATVEEDIRALDTAVTAIPARQEELQALEQRERLLLERFVEAVRKVQDAELAHSLQRSQQGFQVARLDEAVAPTEPMRPRWKLTIFAALAVLAASLLSAVLLEFVDPVILSIRQLEVRTGMLPLGVVPRIR